MVWRFGDDREMEEKRWPNKLPMSFGFENTVNSIDDNKLYIYGFRGFLYQVDYKIGQILDIKLMR